MNWTEDGFTLKEYLLIVEQAHDNTFGKLEVKWHPEDISNNIDLINKVVSETLSNAWEKWHDK